MTWESKKKKKREERERKVRMAMTRYASRKVTKDREIRHQRNKLRRIPKDVRKALFANVKWGRITKKNKRR